MSKPTGETFRQRKNRNAADQRRNRPALALFKQIRSNAKKHGLVFELTESWIQIQLNNKYCAVTGLPFIWGEKQSNGFTHPFRPSIDRINNSIGYIPSNCRLVVWIYNRAKADWSDDDVLKMAIALVERQTL